MFKNLKFKKLSTSLVVVASLLVAQAPFANYAEAAGAEKVEKKKKRKTHLVGPRVGKKVQKAFEAYSADDLKGAIAILLDIDASKAYDKAYVNRMLAVMYATLGDNEQNTIDYLKKAIEPDLLNEVDHGESLKLLGDMQMQTKDYEGALKAYYAWMDFTGKSDGQVYIKIANAYYSLKQLDKVIEPANKAIAAFGDKPNQNPYILKITSYYENKKYKEAVEVLETVIQLFPENKQWWTQLPMFYLLVEDYDKATQTLDLAYKLGYLDKESQIKTLASLYAQSETPYKAAKLLEKHIASGLVKRDDKNISTLANAWHSAQHIDKAASYYGELAKMTSSAKHYRKQGMLLKQDEQFAKAIVALNKAIELGVSNQGRIHMSIAESYFYLEKYKQAYAAIQKAIKDPKSRKSARGWKSFIVDTAKRKNVTI
ncbi:tetratricopeptide repeat protein [Colwellia psychrerythraea]|uniref:Tetratricopeptide TPR_2 repeat-containing protein n=1 Tax=Colwellia psychrerythraea TaxID=28229 RepID=A0A099KZZ9_COLPS|nr:tetratricopeptide repeat protein [Colwellia psychrerythraea]KGJ96319.1 Tetratricopeptide TPR_2 repeat-containing protein [Colwellia psychrerythraea]